MKRVLIGIGIVFASFIAMMVVNGKEIYDCFNLEDAGYQTFEAQSMSTETNRVKTGRNSYSNQTKQTLYCDVDAGGETRVLMISVKEAYETEDALKISKYLNTGKKISGYIFYSTVSDRVYFSREYDNAKDYANTHLKRYISLFAVIAVIFIIPLILSAYLSKYKIKGMPEELIKRSIICSYRTFMFSLLFEICLVSGGIFGYITVNLFKTEGMVVGIMFAALAIAFLALAVFIFMMMKNRIVLFHARGVIFIDTKGTACSYYDDEISHYTDIVASKKHELYIYTKTGKKIAINYYCKNFYDALKYVKGKYNTIVK